MEVRPGGARAILQRYRERKKEEREREREREKEGRGTSLDSSKVVDGKLRFMAFRLYRRESTAQPEREESSSPERIGRDT